MMTDVLCAYYVPHFMASTSSHYYWNRVREVVLPSPSTDMETEDHRSENLLKVTQQGMQT